MVAYALAVTVAVLLFLCLATSFEGRRGRRTP